ncbi:MAG: ThiF family adenylyltransferase [Gammaproteobacteria bacterium]|nr:ThiF family adenylyltransferase [Gammaproteobacteria bacterium]
MDYDPDGRVSRQRIAIVGLGGTGSHVLDLIAKTPVGEIHLYDNDTIKKKNTKRSPGPIETCNDEPLKAEYYRRRYSEADQKIHAHCTAIDERNVEELSSFSTIFLCIDKSKIKERIVNICKESGIVLIIVGLDCSFDGKRFDSMVAVSVGQSGQYDHLNFITPVEDEIESDDNHQTIELNAINAALAVLKWKQILGLFSDDRPYLELCYLTQRSQIYLDLN